MKPRLLVVELHHLGDAVLSVPFVRAAQEKYDVHILCRPAACDVYELLAAPPKCHPWDVPWGDGRECGARESIAAARDRGRVLRALEFSVAVCAWADARAGILIAETRAARRIGFPMTHGNYYAPDIPWRRHRRWLGSLAEKAWQTLHPCRPLLTQWLHRESPRQPHLHCWEQIATALGTTCDYSIPWFDVKPNPSPQRGPRPLLAVHAHARLPSKQWPADRWRALCESPAITDRFDIVEILPSRAEPVTPGTTPRIETPTVAALAFTLAAADAVVCHDSLPAHLAAALGKPVVSIFGSGEPDWFAPWNNRERVVQRRVCPLHPCIDRCGMDGYICLDSIPVSDVAAKISALAPHP